MNHSRRRNRAFHHLYIAAATAALSILFYFLFPQRDLISRLSIATAYPALFLAALTLLPGPFNVLRKRPNPVGFDLRRDLGIWAGIFALAHTAIGLNVHLRGRMWLYFVSEHLHLRKDLFGFANYTGAIAALLFAMLLGLSNDLSLRKFGSRRWKSLQRWSYAAALLTVAHAIAYQQTEKRVWPYQSLLCAVLLVTLAVQLAAARLHRTERRQAVSDQSF